MFEPKIPLPRTSTGLERAENFARKWANRTVSDHLKFKISASGIRHVFFRVSGDTQGMRPCGLVAGVGITKRGWRVSIIGSHGMWNDIVREVIMLYNDYAKIIIAIG